VDPRCQVSVQREDFDPGAPGAEGDSAGSGASGAVVSFVGIARDFSGEFSVEEITLEHYPGMTERSLQDIGEQALRRWDLQQVRIIHRFGRLRPGDRIVLVATWATHRDAAFDACRFIIDLLKTEAPFWKQEAGRSGSRWVEARHSDERSRAAWNREDSEP
jgi:molybdopterin synthase catalytic subunit